MSLEGTPHPEDETAVVSEAILFQGDQLVAKGKAEVLRKRVTFFPNPPLLHPDFLLQPIVLRLLDTNAELTLQQAPHWNDHKACVGHWDFEIENNP